jgi:hypothetical protein
MRPLTVSRSHSDPLPVDADELVAATDSVQTTTATLRAAESRLAALQRTIGHDDVDELQADLVEAGRLLKRATTAQRRAMDQETAIRAARQRTAMEAIRAAALTRQHAISAALAEPERLTADYLAWAEAQRPAIGAAGVAELVGYANPWLMPGTARQPAAMAPWRAALGLEES